MNELAKLLIVAGAALLLLGVVLAVASRVLFIGRLPGDLRFEWRGVRLYFPLATGIILSIILTILVNLWLRR
ncbi:MAG: DUF2905 family protein [Acidobacteriota bacterium]